MGYVLCATIQNNLGWRWAFYIQAIAIFPCIVSILITPKEYMDINWMAKEVDKLLKE